MSNADKSIVTELAEIIAAQGEELRNIRQEYDEQNDLIVDYELDQENTEKVDSAIYSDLEAALNIGTLKGTRAAIAAILNSYFGDY